MAELADIIRPHWRDMIFSEVPYKYLHGNMHSLPSILLHKPALIVHKSRQLCISAGHKVPNEAADWL